jgi:hypothetical protein
MTMRLVSLLSVSIFALTLAAGSAVAGDGKSCGGKKGKNDGDTAVVVTPELPRA